jgi:hypothetical protein
MAKLYYLPRTILGRLAFLKAFVTRLTTAVMAKYGISPSQETDMTNSAAYLDYWLQCQAAAQQYEQALTEFIDNMMNGTTSGVHTMPVLTLPAAPAAPITVPQPGFMLRVKENVQVIKNSPNYTVEDGQALGIEGPEQNVEEDALQPVLTVDVVGNNVVVKSPKQGTQGTEIWVDRGTGYQLAGFCSGTKYTDPTPIPATATALKYKGRFHLHGEAVGQFSNEVKINVGG